MKKNYNLRLWLDRTISGGVWMQILVAAVLFGVVFVMLGIAYSAVLNRCAFGQTFADMSSGISLRSILYDTPNNGKPFPETILIWLAYIFGTLLLSGVLIATITNGLRTRSDRFRNGNVRYRFRKHIVFLGYDDLILGMIEKLCVESKARIVVAVAADAAKYNEQLLSQLSKECRKRVVVLRANRCNDADLRRLKVNKASNVYIVGEPHEETHDTLNINCFQVISRLCREKEMPDCYVNIGHQSTFALFQTFVQSGDKKFDAALKHFHSFNFYDEWARLMVTGEYLERNHYEHFRLECRENDDISRSPEKMVHLVIVGVTQMGVAMAREAAIICHYPGFIQLGVKTKITFVDKNASEKITHLVGHYHHLFDHCCYSFCENKDGKETTIDYYPEKGKDFLDIEFEFVEADIDSIMMRNKLTDWAIDPKQFLTVAICFESSHHSIATALYMPDAVTDSRIPVWIYQPAQGNLAAYLKGSKFSNVISFGMSGADISTRIKSKDILQAQRLNHFYWNLKDANVDYTDTNKMIEEWNSCHIYERWSSLYNVAAIPTKLQGIGGIDNIESNIEILSKVEHNRWNVEKLLMGFRSTTTEEHENVTAKGKPEKDRLKDLFIHDDIRPFDQLDKNTADIDRRFSREIPKIIAS